MSDKCQWCNMMHMGRCPQVKAFEYYADGALKRVEFFSLNDYPPLSATWDIRNVSTILPGSVAYSDAAP